MPNYRGSLKLAKSGVFMLNIRKLFTLFLGVGLMCSFYACARAPQKPSDVKVDEKLDADYDSKQEVQAAVEDLEELQRKEEQYQLERQATDFRG